MAQQLVEVQGVTRRYPSGNKTIEALKDVSADFLQGSFTILRGPSGSGKTTLLNIIGTLDRPNEGDVVFAGNRLSRLSEAQREKLRRLSIGFVFQSVALVSSMSAFENIDFLLRVCRVPPAERKKRARECLELVGLGKRMHHRPPELSGGEQQRVAIARAIAPRPRLILADEPTAELDTRTGLHVVKIFRDLVKNEGMTVIMTTHDPNMMEIADRVVELRDGKVVPKSAESPAAPASEDAHGSL